MPNPQGWVQHVSQDIHTNVSRYRVYVHMVDWSNEGDLLTSKCQIQDMRPFPFGKGKGVQNLLQTRRKDGCTIHPPDFWILLDTV